MRLGNKRKPAIQLLPGDRIMREPKGEIFIVSARPTQKTTSMGDWVTVPIKDERGDERTPLEFRGLTYPVYLAESKQNDQLRTFIGLMVEDVMNESSSDAKRRFDAVIQQIADEYGHRAADPGSSPDDWDPIAPVEQYERLLKAAIALSTEPDAPSWANAMVDGIYDLVSRANTGKFKVARPGRGGLATKGKFDIRSPAYVKGNR